MYIPSWILLILAGVILCLAVEIAIYYLMGWDKEDLKQDIENINEK